MSINERLIHTTSDTTSGSGNQEEGLILYLDANDVDSYDGTGSVWYDITNHEYTPEVDPAEHFNTVTYTGNGSSSGQSITGVGFQPDLVWVKERGTTGRHQIQDSVNGDGWLDSSDTLTYAPSQAHIDNRPVETFDSDGFTIPSNYTYNNGNNDTFVAWCFKAGGAPSGSDKVSIDGTSYSTMTAAGLTDGTEAIDKLSVNTKLGFSIVKYTAPALRVDTVAHGLGETPEMIIHKSTSVSRNWNVFHKDVGISKNLHLNTTDAANTSEDWTANSTTFSIQDYSSSADWVAYCFASKRGVSKVGSYSGTGSSGNKVYTGFEPAWVIIKRTNASGNSWLIVDNKRIESNGNVSELFADTTTAESGTGYDIDFNKDGFTLNTTTTNANASGGKYIYLAFAAEKPSSLIDDTDLELHLDAGDSSTTSSNWDDLSSNSYGETLTSVTYDEELGNWFTLTSGTHRKVSINDNGALTNVDNFTVEMWANVKDNSGYRYLWSNMNTDTSVSKRQVYGQITNDDKVEFTVYSGNGSLDYKQYMTAAVASTIHNKWVHYVFVLENGLPSKIYLNGVDTSISVAGTGSGFGSGPMHKTSTVDFAIGNQQRTSTTATINGDVGQVRVYHNTLTADQVMQNYRFTKNDYPNGINGTLVGPSWNPSGYFDFNGTSDYVTFNYSKWHDDFSVSFWVYFDDLTLGKLFDKTTWYASSHQAFPFSIAASSGTVTASISYGNDYSFDVNASGSYTTGKWYHILVTAEHGDKLKIWSTAEDGTFNSTPSGEAAYTGTVNGSGNNNYTIGRASTVYGGGVGQDSFLDGRISKLKMFDKVLSESERSAQFDEGA